MIRTCATILLALVLVVPAFAAERVTVAQLEAILATASSATDSNLAAQLSTLQLTERFDSTRVEHWKASMPGIHSQRALVALADRSAFLDPPGDRILSIPAPAIDEQRRIMGLTATYVSKAIPQLPRFFASRTTTHFEDRADSARNGSWLETDSLRATRISRAVVSYQEGQEILQPGLYKVENTQSPESGLKSWGTFGPILGLVLVDAAKSTLAWERWEKTDSGQLAVFRYAVPKDRSHYQVRYCCVASAYGMESTSFQQMSAYHGEIAVDPATGVIQRLTLEAELDGKDPITRAALAVEYAPVELGGVTYTCPVRSISISLAQTLRKMQDQSGHPWIAMGPPQLLLNDVSFSQYHLFRSESRVLSAAEERQSGLTPDATLPQTPATDLLPAEEDIADAPASKPAAPATASESTGAATAQAENSADQEITTTHAGALPDVPVQPAAQSAKDEQPSGLTLRVNTRLVDVNVVALDKKGRPITNLKPEDFEVYDNGIKQSVSSFMQANAEAAPELSTPVSATPAEFSNRAPQDAGATSAAETSVVLLIDAANLDMGDLTDAREQMVRFIRTLAPHERLAIYLMKYHGYEVLHELNSDHEALAAQLAGWKPAPQDVANAQDEEMRNRQQIETVHNPEDELSVNGNYTLDSSTQTEALDPKLRELGSRPGPNALGILVEVAHHLSALPGHKNLVWVTSDNALADWNKLSYDIDKGSKYIEPIALRAQEALNNAHVSVYPLDASRLEAAVITADIRRRNVELSPTYERPPFMEKEMEGAEVTAGKDMNAFSQCRITSSDNRLTAAMEQDLHPIQGVFREVADATGGRVFRRSSDIIRELNDVVADGHATYLLGFSPTQQADGQYHRLTVKLIGHHDATLRFRSGYQYDKEPTTLKERFAHTVWQPMDTSEITVSAKIVSDAQGDALRVTVAGSDLALKQQSSRWLGKLDIFLVRRDAEALHAKVSGLTVGLRLKPATYERAMKEGLTFDERVDTKQANGTMRVIVVDVNTGRIGSVTVPSTALQAKR